MKLHKASRPTPTASLCLRSSPRASEWPRVVLLLVLGISEYNKLCLLAVSSVRLLMKT